VIGYWVLALGWTMLAVTVAANVLRWWRMGTLGSGGQGE